MRVFIFRTTLMGFLSILHNIKQLQNELRILTIGLDNSGKTTTIKSLLN